MSKNREIFDPNPDEVEQFDKRLSGFATRDFSGVPLGDVSGHALNRLDVCYGILQTFDVAAELARYENDEKPLSELKVLPTGAAVQDWQATMEYPAAHRAPCNLLIANPSTASQTVQQLFKDGTNRGFIAKLFGQTDIVHYLANYADRLCEGTNNRMGFGISHVLARNCELLLHDEHLTAKELFFDSFMPEFRNVLSRKHHDYNFRLSRNQTSAPSVILDALGRPFNQDPLRNDYRVGRSAPRDVRLANQRAVAQILSTYAATVEPRRTNVVAMDEKFKAVRYNEQQERTHGSPTRSRP
jgi:hypothetical protein